MRFSAVEATLDFLRTQARLVSADLTKFSRYRVTVIGYLALVIFSILAAILVYHTEQALAVTPASGYQFAIGLMFRFLDFGALILYVLLCLVFAIEVSNSTIKCILTRAVTRTELILSKFLTAMVMVIIALGSLWIVALGSAAYYYGLGDLVENDYVIFRAGYVFGQIAVGTLFLLIPFAALAAMALMVSSFSNTLGEATILGLVGYFFFQILGLIPASLGMPFHWGDEVHLFSYGTLGFPSQRFVPMYVLDDLPSGIPIESWWTWDIQKMTLVCGVFFAVFASTAVMRVRSRDFTL